LVPYLL